MLGRQAAGGRADMAGGYGGTGRVRVGSINWCFGGVGDCRWRRRATSRHVTSLAPTP